jgi:hypothetical protein
MGRRDAPVLLVAESRPATAELVGEVVGRRGPGAGARAWIARGPRGTTAVADATGRAVLRGIPSWPLVVQVSSPLPPPPGLPLAPQTFDDVRPDAGPLVVRLVETVPLRGHVVDAAGRPVQNAWVAALRGLEYAACFGTTAEGLFEANSNVPEGTRLFLTARFPSDEPTARGFAEVVAGRDEPTIVLEELGPLSADPQAAGRVVFRVGTVESTAEISIPRRR